MSQLDTLAQHREALLLAEAIGWLHDYRKCSDEILSGGGSPRPDLLRNVPLLSGLGLSISGLRLTEAIETLLHNWKGKANDSTVSQLLQYLSRCHNTAHFDKQDPIGGTPNYPIVQISSPFGYEVDIPINLTNKLWNLPWDKLAHYSDPQRQELQKAVTKLFTQTVADSRQPINEVDLWSWGVLVGALYKSALAGALLTGTTPVTRDLRWRLLGVRVNGLDYLLNAARIPDLLARQELLTDGLNKVCELLELSYPLGSEIYRDENGSVYVVPDLPDLLDRTDAGSTSLHTLIRQTFAQGTIKGRLDLQLGEEMVPHIELEQTPWWGQDPDWPNSANDELPKISDFLNRTFISSANPHAIRPYWDGKVADICTVCGLRPQGPGAKAKDRNVCDICEQRRADRSQKWATSQPDQTIWNDEVADVNGRIALITGQFDLHHWLDGRLLETLFVIAPNTNGTPATSKNPSFSRLRRIWETARTFWNEVQMEILHDLSDDRRRLKIYLNRPPQLSPFNAYDLAVGAFELSVVWVPDNNNSEGYLISIDNLNYLARQLGANTGVYQDSAAAAIFVEDYLRTQFLEQSRQPILYNADAPAGRGKKNLINGISVRQIEYQTNQYATAIPILAEPRSFMMLVPADKSLAILQRIKEKYEQEMGKVRNRLPLNLGAVFFGRRTPLFAALDAARQMLKVPATSELNSESWIVDRVDGNGQVKFKNGLTWHVPTVMGDGQTEDLWYPYFELAGPPATHHTRHFQQGEKTWVHVKNLQPDDVVRVTPSTFDFEFLDTTARRFEVHYDKNGRRPARPTRPFYLEDLQRFETLWDENIRQLTRTQLKQILQTIETTRQRWFERDEQGKSADDTTFRKFVADTLATAAWPKSHPWKSNPQKEELITAATRGILTDWAELHLEILKEELSENKKQGATS